MARPLTILLLFVLVISLTTFFTFHPIYAQPTTRGDIDGDGDVDRGDFNLIKVALNTNVGANDGRDLDTDGRITVRDLRILVTLCTRVRCIESVVVEIQVNNTPSDNDDYITWSPTFCRARVVGSWPLECQVLYGHDRTSHRIRERH